MPFPCCPKRKDHSHFMLFQKRLVKILDNGRIKKCRGFDGIFHGKIGTDEHSSLNGNSIKINIHLLNYASDTITMLMEKLGNVTVPACKFPKGLLQGVFHLTFTHSENKGKQIHGALFPVHKGAGHDPTGIG